MINLIFLLLFNLSYGQVTVNQAQDLIHVNEMSNGGAENGLLGWIGTGVTVTSSSWAVPSKQFGKKYFSFAFNGGVASRVEYVMPIPTHLLGKECTFSYYLKLSASATDYRMLVLNSSNVSISPSQLISATTNLEKSSFNFTCPTSGDVKFRITDYGGQARTITADGFTFSIYNRVPEKFFYSGYIEASSGSVSYNMPPGTWPRALETNNATLVSNIGTAAIACVSGSNYNPTCPVNETSGVSVEARSSMYQVCTWFNTRQDNAAETHAFRISRYDGFSMDSRLSEGRSRVRIESVDGSNAGVPVQICETFDLRGLGLSRVTFVLEHNRYDSAGSDFILYSSGESNNMWTVQEL